MKANEADQIARRIANVWRSTPSIVEWREKLTPLDYDACIAAFTELRDKQEGSLSVAQFVKQYRPPRSSGAVIPSRCELCDGTGWRRSGLDLVLGTDDDFEAGTARVQEQVEPCNCSKGSHARLTQETIDAERTPLTMPHRYVRADTYPPSWAEKLAVIRAAHRTEEIAQ